VCIEIDGDSHAELGQAEYDTARTAALIRRGYREVRFTNGQVETNLSAVLEAIRAACEPPSPPPSP
jgi:very-short-patch-repair endonuclease